MLSGAVGGVPVQLGVVFIVVAEDPRQHLQVASLSYHFPDLVAESNTVLVSACMGDVPRFVLHTN